MLFFQRAYILLGLFLCQERYLLQKRSIPPDGRDIFNHEGFELSRPEWRNRAFIGQALGLSEALII
ncbi:MAG: hypothetical protein A2218_10230 [Elusimicrobia bacterium RIFOXYA2_FULL_53_38]|nr:MAG: hypothetical protein A2218_10230 [Elusimicrobia bacterium RIFOXYA2_FULL_53_38]